MTPSATLSADLLQSGAGAVSPPGPPRNSSGLGGSAVHDLYSDLFARTPKAAAIPAPAAPVAPPRQPTLLADCGLTLGFLSELVLKLLYVHGSLLGQEIAHQLRLVFPIVDEALRFLKDQRCIEVSSGELVGRVSYRFALTELGRLRAREVFEQCRYVGPAPVAMEHYVAQSRRQTVTGIPCTPAALKLAFEDFILRPGLVEELGPAVCTGRSIFVYGPPGNGKTVIAKGLGRYLNAFGGELYVPYALLAENTIITVFDPVLHQTTDDSDLARRGVIPKAAVAAESTTVTAPETSIDLRWRRIRRPVIITGGELTLEMLELQHHKVSNFYNAPLHIKANGGVFLIDDFGRQLVSPRDLLNRWIVPLEERIDYLTLTTGRKFALPFEQLIIFSTNLDPKDLVDDAFLRRIRYKIRVDPPTRDVFCEIFAAACRQRGLPAGDAAVAHLFETYYDHGRPPRSSDARDFLDLAEAECRFHGRPVEWTHELIAHTAQRLFHQM